MSLTDTQIWDLAKKMSVPLVFCDFKDNLAKTKLKYNKFYIINMENEFDEDGKRNEGSHYTAFQINKYPTGKIEGVYFDPFGMPPPQIVQKFCGLPHLPYNTKDIQSLMNSACGWYALAFGHFINAWDGRTKDLYTDCAGFTDLFDDLNKTASHHKNEWVLKNFFRPADAKVREANPVDIFKAGDIKHIADPDSIDGQDEDAHIRIKV
jgi:hypothetical protein